MFELQNAARTIDDKISVKVQSNSLEKMYEELRTKVYFAIFKKTKGHNSAKK